MRIAGEEREILSQSSGSDEKVHCSGATWLASSGRDCGEDSAVGAGRVGTERKRVEDGLGPLEPVLAAAAFGWVVGGVWTGGQFGQGEGADGNLEGE